MPIAATSTPSSRNRSVHKAPKSSRPTALIMAQGWPSRAAWSMKIAGAPEANGPMSEIGARKPCPAFVAMISTRISPMVSIRFIRGPASPAPASGLREPLLQGRDALRAEIGDLVDLALGDDQRRREAERVAHAARDQAVLISDLVEDHAGLQVRIERLPALLVGDDLDSEHQAGAADLADDRRFPSDRL